LHSAVADAAIPTEEMEALTLAGLSSQSSSSYRYILAVDGVRVDRNIGSHSHASVGGSILTGHILGPLAVRQKWARFWNQREQLFHLCMG
jgi:hypothetical protein